MALLAVVLNLDGDPDVTAPILTSPSVSNIRQTQVAVSVTTDEATGTLYWYGSASATPPSATDLKAGTGATASGNQAISGLGENTIASAGAFSAEFSGYIHLLHTDVAGNDSNIVTTAQFTTLEALAPLQFSISPAGNNVLLVLNRGNWFIGAGGSGGFAVTSFSGGSVTLGTPFGEDTDTIAIPISNRTIGQSETGGLLAYTQPGNGIEDGDGNDMPSFSDFAVLVPNGSSVDDIAPTLVSASVNDTALSLTFPEIVTFGAGGNTGWTITPSGGAATVSYSSGSGSTVLVYTVSRSIEPGETLTGAYTQPTAGVVDGNANELATIASFAITNLLVDLRHKRTALLHNTTSFRHKDTTLTHNDTSLRHNG